MKQEIFLTMDWREFEGLVKEHIGKVVEAAKKYNFLEGQEANNDNVYQFQNVTGKLTDFDRKELREGKLQYRAGMLFEALVEMGVLKPANYLVRVSW